MDMETELRETKQNMTIKLNLKETQTNYVYQEN